MGFFALGLEKVTIYSNREWFNSAEVRFHSFVADQQISLPEAQGLLDSDSAAKRRKAVRALAARVLGHWQTIEVTNIPDRHTFTFGDTGRILFRSTEIPTSLDWFMLAIDDDSDIRKLGGRLGEYLTNEKADNLSKAIIALAGVTAGPATAAGIVIGKDLISGITYLLKGNKDDQLGVVEQSFIRPLHYPTGTRHGVGIQDLSGNMWYDYFIYGTDEV